MKLRDYIDKAKITFADFADRIQTEHNIKCSEYAVYSWYYGYREPRKNAKKAISAITNGKVTANDFLD